ncbi:hypothetical protein D9613_005370 [Agrocybe pediades]|uniref:Ubiquitin-like domain-containing protein n=1 Tax=Agrocybe pediades TaxID=84607 RepID=A0A8H4QXK6_9AGAR|nr:hypothetical protein D9613_005370 [Agrocybe pediades]
MSLLDIRVDFPSYSRSFTVQVQPSCSVLELKREIQRSCEGQPRPDGQRLIWRGRVLTDDENIDNLWKNDPRIVHLAVHPSAWTSSPPEIPKVQQPEAAAPTPTRSFSRPRPPATYSQSPGVRWTPNEMISEFDAEPTSNLVMLSYVHYKHQLALSYLCPSLPPPTPLDNAAANRLLAYDVLEVNGWRWPAVLDEEFPPRTEGGVEYKITDFNGKSYLELIKSDEAPTLAQQHSLKVLSITFTILSLSLPASLTPRPTQSLPAANATVPADVNELLRRLGMPPLRVANNNANPLANQNNPVVAEIRQIPIRPLLAPLIMLLLRTLLLLYFVAPARKPFFSILVLAWMLYEIWQPIRHALNRAANPNEALGRDDINRPRPGQNPGQPQQQANGGPQAPVGVNPGVNVPIRPGPVGPVTLDAQAGAIFDTLANINIEEEQRILDQAAGAPTTEPGLGHKIWTFLALFLTTLHPAIWNRRRVALRRREGVVRTEANVRNAPPPTVEEGAEPTPEQNAAIQRQEELRAQHARRPRWIQRYMARVVAEDWVDDSD